MEYRNKQTGEIFSFHGTVSGDNWEEVKVSPSAAVKNDVDNTAIKKGKAVKK